MSDEVVKPGIFIDCNTGLPVKGEYSLRDRPGHEFWKEKARAERDGLTQQQFNIWMANPDFYEITDRRSKRSFHARWSSGLTELHFAVLSGDQDAVEKLLRAGVPVDVLDKCNRPPLMYAIVEGCREIFDLLLRNGSCVSLRDKNGFSALHFAALYHRLNMAETLLHHGALVDVRDNWGDTPLWRATYAGADHPEMIRLLLAHGANRYEENDHGVSPRDLDALHQGRQDLARFFSEITQ